MVWVPTNSKNLHWIILAHIANATNLDYSNALTAEFTNFSLHRICILFAGYFFKLDGTGVEISDITLMPIFIIISLNQLYWQICYNKL